MFIIKKSLNNKIISMKNLLVAIGLFIAMNASAEDGIVVRKSKQVVNVEFNAKSEGWATLEIKDGSGEVVLEQQMVVSNGDNTIPVFFTSKLGKGTYNFVLKFEDKVYSSKFVKE